MTKTKSLFIIYLALLIAIFSGCRNNDNYSETKTKGNTDVVTTAESTTEEKTVSEATTEKESSSETTTKTAKKKSAGQTTTKKVTTTQKSTTTKRQTTTKKVTTTHKPTTTQKVTTTKKPTTTVAPYWCDEGGTHHIVDVGPIGWCNSFDEATDKALEYISEHGDSGNFRVKQCYGCGKYTATVTIH